MRCQALTCLQNFLKKRNFAGHLPAGSRAETPTGSSRVPGTIFPFVLGYPGRCSSLGPPERRPPLGSRGQQPELRVPVVTACSRDHRGSFSKGKCDPQLRECVVPSAPRKGVRTKRDPKRKDTRERWEAKHPAPGHFQGCGGELPLLPA